MLTFGWNMLRKYNPNELYLKLKKQLMKICELYRVKDWIKNLGIILISFMYTGLYENIFKLLLIIFQFSLLFSYGFSINNFFDYKICGERNFFSRCKKKSVMSCILPLLILIPTLYFYSSLFFLIFFLLYSFYSIPPFRLKNYFIFSIFINSLCIVIIPFFSLFQMFSVKPNLQAIVLSIIYFFYLNFHETIHQIAHSKTDRKCGIKSLPNVLGLKKSLKCAKIFLIVPIVFSLLALIINFQDGLIFFGTIFFSFLRIFKLSKVSVHTNFEKIREKFYGVHEGIYYLSFKYVEKIFLN
jgi:4-hydroxybenzoate polyprenyltransferase